jgi:hypothetical protein
VNDAATVMNRVRRAESGVELQRLRDDLTAWLAHRRSIDERGQYRTQLNAIQKFVNDAAQTLENALNGMPIDRPTAEVYDECRLFDLCLLWVRRSWQFFRDKFDQRDDPTLQEILASADEVIWSCYRQVFVSAQSWGLKVHQGPVPLAFIEPKYSAEAFPAELIPADLKDIEVAPFVREHLEKLPAPIVRLPPTCVAAPWWLVLIGHEVGHHIQHELDLVMSHRESLGAAIEREGGDAGDVRRWRAWSMEIFADVFSVLMMGSWAVWAMVELELKPRARMVERRERYPEAIVRLELLAQTANELELDGRAALHSLDTIGIAQSDPVAAHDLEFVPVAVEATLDAGTPLEVELRDLCGFSLEHFRPEGTVDAWSRTLRGLGNRRPRHELREARLIASASLQAWAQVMSADSSMERSSLVERSLLMTGLAYERGLRGPQLPSGDIGDIGSNLAKALLRVPREELEALR